MLPFLVCRPYSRNPGSTALWSQKCNIFHDYLYTITAEACSFQRILSDFHRAGFHASIVMQWEMQSRRHWFAQKSTKRAQPLLIQNHTDSHFCRWLFSQIRVHFTTDKLTCPYDPRNKSSMTVYNTYHFRNRNWTITMVSAICGRSARCQRNQSKTNKRTAVNTFCRQTVWYLHGFELYKTF